MLDSNYTSAIVGWLNDYAPQGILVTDHELIIRGWNRWLEQHSSQSESATVGRPLFDVFPEIVERHLDQFYREVLDGQAKVLSYRFHQYLVRLPTKSEY